MKSTTILLMLFILLTSVTASAQEARVGFTEGEPFTVHVSDTVSSVYKQYLKKSHDQKVTATIFGIGGSVMLLTGAGLAAASFKGFFDPTVRHNDYGSAPDILMIGGGALIVAAVPFSLASRANKKKARLYMNKENVMITPEIKTATQLASIGIKISL